MKMHSSFVLLPLLFEGTTSAALRGRQTSYTEIAGYEPSSDVTEHLKVDLDVTQMIDYLESGDFTSAQDIYENGANSGGYASFVLRTSGLGLSTDITAGTSFTVSQDSNTEARGYVKEDASSGDTALTVYYTSTCIARGTTKDTLGCFDLEGNLTIATSSGDVTVAASELRSTENLYRTLQGFSTGANAKMSDQVFYQDYELYYRDTVSAYGGATGAYGDMFVLQALATPLSEGDKFYGLTARDARVEVAQKSAVYLNVWMYVVREMEDAIDDCDAGDLVANDDAVKAWDEAVAFYVGSQEGDDGSGSGSLLYALADKRCKDFGTCDDDDSKTSLVNVAVMELFDTGKAQMLSGDCSGLVGTKNSIVKKMTVPLVQGTLKYAYTLANLGGGDKELAEGYTFAAAVLPRLAVCDSNAAAVVASNLNLDGSTSSGTAYDQTWVMADGFDAVKEAFEDNYACLGFSCADVGGLVYEEPEEGHEEDNYAGHEGDGAYYDGFEPCGADGDDSSNSLSGGAIAAIVIAVVLIVAAVALAFYYMRRYKAKHEAYKEMQAEMSRMKGNYPTHGLSETSAT